jgi:signal transduction histidine kinase
MALMLAVWSSKRIMAPVSDLARRISGMGQDIHPEPLAPAYADDEVGQLAGALDEYADRLTALVVRDKEFNADVSHELRTPLSVIQSATELLMAQGDLEEKTKTRLERIKRATKQSTELTEALLHLVRAERVDRATGEYYRIDKIVDEVVDFKKHQLGRKPVEVRVHVEDSFLVCAPDAVIAVTLGNLIGNAFKYTPKGSVDITVGDGLVIVEDTGPGLDDAELQKVFTRHYRGSTADGKGSGLGLAIVQRFCELYEWEVEIQARDVGGLRTTISFGQVK